MKIVFASHNPGKIQELRALIAPLLFEIVPQGELGIHEVAETGKTFVENALLKARHATLHTHLPVIADDSGLIVEGLNGAPGIYSARYAGEHASASENMQKVLTELTAAPGNNRHAFFYCVIVLLRHADDPTPLICEGRWHGTLLEKPRGAQGFGYDPIFFDPSEQCSAAELSPTKKNQLSHRAHALQCLLEKLRHASLVDQRP